MRELTDKEKALCLFLAQIDAGIYIAWKFGRDEVYRLLSLRHQSNSYFRLMPVIYFNVDPDRQAALEEIRNGPEPIIFRLSPEFRNQPDYQEYMVL